MTLDPNSFLTEVSTVFGTVSAHNNVIPVTGNEVDGYNDAAYDYVEQRLEVLRRFLASEDSPNALNLTNNIFQLFAQIDPNTANQTLTVNMVKDLEALYLTFQSIPASDPDPGGPAVDTNLWIRWRDLSRIDPTINEIIERGFRYRNVGGQIQGDYYTGIATEFLESLTAVDLGTNQNVGSLQALVELIYIRKANEIMANNLEVLESDLAVTKETLDSLTELLNLHNNITVFGRGEFGYAIDNSGGSNITNNYQSARDTYNEDVDAFFGEPIKPQVSPELLMVDEAVRRLAEVFEIDNFANELEDFNGLSSTINTLITAVEQNNSSSWTNELISTNIQQNTLTAIERKIADAKRYNQAIIEFNKVMEPINERLDGQTLTVNGIFGSENVQITFPFELPTIPTVDFNPDIIPFSFPGANANITALRNLAETLSGTNTALDYYENDFLDKMTAISANLLTTNNTEKIVKAGEFLANAIYSRDEIINGTSTLPPLETFTFLEDINELYAKIERIVSNLSGDPALEQSQSSLLNRLEQVLEDLDESGFQNISYTGQSIDFEENNFAISSRREHFNNFVQNWVVDKNDLIQSADIGEVGKFQDNISFAISSAQALNDEQKEDTRSFLFVFEEYYKSAAAILSKLTQILEKLAQGISR